MVARTVRLLLGVVATCGLVLAGCGSRTGFLDGDGVSLPDDDATGNAGSAGSGGSAGAAGLGLGGGSMGGSGGSIGQVPPEVEPTLPPDGVTGCGDDGRFEGDVVIFGSADFAQLEGCTVVDGNLQISARVADLEPLRQLREVRGTFSVVRGPLSLQGLENLQEVQVLQLDSIAARSLQPLAGLRRVRTLQISGDLSQGNLNGLGGIVNLRELRIDNSTLPRLVGLAVPFHMNSISIMNSSTTDLGVLEGVAQIDRDLVLRNLTGLTSLDALSSLTLLGGLAITDNPDLVQIDALDRLGQVDRLVILDNPLLEHLPDFDGPSFIESVQIARNAALRSVPRFSRVNRIGLLSIQSNPALERIVFPSLGAVADSNGSSTLSIAENPVLAAIDAPALASADNLLIAANLALANVAVPSLQSVAQRLTVIMNPALPSASLGPLLTATSSLRKIGANQGDTPLTSCPWTNDDHCDQTSNVCAAGSDLVDCSNGFAPY